MYPAFAAIVMLLFSTAMVAQKTVSFPASDGGVVYADLYGSGTRGVVLAHGGQFNKESWKNQALALAEAGFLVAAIDFRGYGPSRGPGQSDVMSAPLFLDVLAAVEYLKKSGAPKVSIVGASLGGWAAADAALKSPAIDRIVFLGSSPTNHAEQLKVRSLFIVARDDTSGSGDGPRLPGIRAQFQKMREPKELMIVEGSAHAQHLFETNQAELVMHAILRFLTAK